MPTLASSPDTLTDEQLRALNVTREYLRHRNLEKAQLDALAPRVGDVAPEFSLERLGASDGVEPCRAALSDYRGRPLALIFGSYTCPVFRRQIPRFNAAHRRFGERVEFLGIYVREAHPEDGWRVPQNDSLGCVIPQPRTSIERHSVAQLCRDRESIPYALAIDDIDDPVMRAYAGSPERLYAVGPDGVVRFKSAIGPFDELEIDAWEATLQALST